MQEPVPNCLQRHHIHRPEHIGKAICNRQVPFRFRVLGIIYITARALDEKDL